MSERTQPRTCERIAADSTSVMCGVQPERGGTPALPAARILYNHARCVVTLPSQCVTLPDPHRDYYEDYIHDTHGWRPDEEDSYQAQGTSVPNGALLRNEFWWQVLLDNNILEDVDKSWNAPLFAAVRDGFSFLILVVPRVDYRGKLYGDKYFIDCRHPRWITSESIRTGRRRPLRAVQGVSARLPYVQRASPPAPPPPAAASEQPTASAGPATQVPPWSPAYVQPGPPPTHPPPAAASGQPTASAGRAFQVPPWSPAYMQPGPPPAHPLPAAASEQPTASAGPPPQPPTSAVPATQVPIWL
jgi:hypothetical protein